MKKRYLEAGKIVNTHGVRGEVKIQPWADGPEFLKGFRKLYVDGKPFEVISAKVHKGCLIAMFAGIDNIDSANLLRNKVVHIDREDAKLPKGSYFLQDVIGLPAINDDTNETIGNVKEILNMPASDVYVIDNNGEEVLVPAVPEFIKSVDIEAGFIRIKLIEGM